MAWQKGQSGNPGGRKKDVVNVMALARQHTPQAIKTLHEICSDPKMPPNARVQAAVAILDRGWGKPAQTVQVQKQEPKEMSDAELIAIATGGLHLDDDEELLAQALAPETLQ
jgi:hypothetical protein